MLYFSQTLSIDILICLWSFSLKKIREYNYDFFLKRDGME